MKISKIVGKPVVSMADGEGVGVVKDFHIDVDKLRATALVLGGVNGFGLLPLDLVKSFGDDAITIENTGVIQWTTGHLAAASGREASTLNKSTVVDGEGNSVGELQDINLDLPGGQITSLQVGGGGVFGIGGHKEEIPAAHIRMIGPSLITVEPLETIRDA